MNNKEIAHIFNTIADILEIKDENFFRIRAYRKAAQNIENLTQDIAQLMQGQQKTKIPGIGADLEAKINELITTGHLAYLDDLKKTIPEGLLEIMSIPGVGPKKTKLLYDQLNIDSIAALEKAARNHSISDLFGIKEKTEENILKGIELIRQKHGRILLLDAKNIADEVIQQLKKIEQVEYAEAAGSLRRSKETVRDIDILATANNPKSVMQAFTAMSLVESVAASGQTKASVITKQGIQVDLRVVRSDDFGAAWCYFTGSKEHNIRLRELGKRKGLKVNEYGVFKEKTNRKIAGKTEKDVYASLGLKFIEPELRENTGEIEAAEQKSLPNLVRLKDIRADLHVHSNWSDGALTILEMAKAAQQRGYEYMLISDHSQSLKIARGMSIKRINQQLAEIKQVNKKLRNFTVLCGAEVEVKSDGELDYSDDILKKLDVVLAAVHSGFKQSPDQITMRIIKAMQNKYVNIIVHPFGRLINERPGYDFDFEKVLLEAQRTNTALEINSHPKRMDLDSTHVRWAKEKGVMLAISTDAHAKEQLAFMDLGVSVARRGWLEKKNVLNCLSRKEFLKRIKK